MLIKQKQEPSIDRWLKEAREDPASEKCGMYLTHNGIVRKTARAMVRDHQEDTSPVTGMIFSYDEKKVEQAIEETYRMEGIYDIRVWLNSGQLTVGDSIMLVMIGGDIRPHVIDALQFLVGKIKSECVQETELN